MEYTVAFIALVVLSGQIIDITNKIVTHVTSQSVVSNSLISERWGEIYSDHLEYILPLGDDYGKMVNFLEYLATMKVHTAYHKGNQLFHAVC